ncbi:DNA-binding protein P3A2-like [Mercenaria mercenaria]|uniref:DNA-binding protein P3A2-like n=1 Tax=Mercenaria mercenaria TaxID=6596 RepID=UPI001E1DF3DB|nr:DNA-binding protein P3A2-like [Mercenaria mercenaria]XP_045164240.1 DNA-binding protein P3A2-like [Mercenaria mercenaria]
MDSTVPVTVNTAHEMMSDLSEPSSPESEMYDTSELLGSVSDDVTNQLAAAGPVGVAAAAAVLSTRKRKHPHHFETNPARRKRQQTRLLRKLRHTIEEYSTRVGQQAVVLCCTPNVSQSMQMYKVFGSQPLENVVRNNKQQILQDLEQSLQEQTPPTQQDNSGLHELPPLVIDGIPTQVDKMTQAQLRNFIPEMLKYSTGRSKPGWGRTESRPVWWPSDLPWANVRSDVRTEEDKKRVPWTEALRQIVKNCYMHHGRQDLLQVFKDEPVSSVTVQTQQPFAGTMMQTINNPDGSVSIIQIDPGPNRVLSLPEIGQNQVVTLPDGTQATVVHAIQDTSLQQQQQQQPQQEVQISQNLPQFAEISANGNQVVSTQELSVVTGSQQAAISALQASINSAGQIILTGADASQLGGIMTVLPVSMYQPVQTVQQIPANLNFQLQQPANQAVEIPMVTVAGGDAASASLQGEDNSSMEVKEETSLEEGSVEDSGQLNMQDTDDTSPSELQILP